MARPMTLTPHRLSALKGCNLNLLTCQGLKWYLTFHFFKKKPTRKGTSQLSPPPFRRSEPERKRRKAAAAAMSRVLGSCRVLMAAAKGGAKEPVARAVTKEAAAAPPAAAAATKPKGGLWKPVPVSPAMRKFLGVQEITRMEAVKKIWEHIKANQLQVRAPPSPMFFFSQ